MRSIRYGALWGLSLIFTLSQSNFAIWSVVNAAVAEKDDTTAAKEAGAADKKPDEGTAPELKKEDLMADEGTAELKKEDLMAETEKAAAEDEVDADVSADEDNIDDQDPVVEESGPADLNETDWELAKAELEPHEFQAEVSRLMDIIINSLYTEKEVFLRELISNSADALEKIRFLSVEDPSVLGDAKDLKVTVDFDKDSKTLSVTDTGVGMTKQDLINNLGTVAKSGTANFLEALSKGGDMNLIGQFGVGFYSAFLVADKVTVTSKHNDDDQHIWTSTADASFSILKDPRGNTLGRGTRITLHIKDDSADFLDRMKLSSTLTRYSQFVNYPIYLVYPDKIQVDAPKEDTEKETKDDVEVTEGEDDSKKKPAKIEKTVHKQTQVNMQKPIWLRSKEEVTDKEYNSFYRSLVQDDHADDPLTAIHFTAEGEIEFKALLYIPAHQLSDPYSGFFGKKQNLKLYVRRVLVAEKLEDIVPSWLTFLRGVIDSDDLPLKVDRESVAQNKAMKVISKRILRKTLDVLNKIGQTADKADLDLKEIEGKKDEDLTEEEKTKKQEDLSASKKYRDFHREFGKNIKLGCVEDKTNQSKMAKLLRFFTSSSPGEPVGLQTVADRTVSNSTIYYITGDSSERMMQSPLIEGLLAKGHEILLLSDAVDEPCLSGLGSFEGRKLVSVEKEEFGSQDHETDDEKAYSKKLDEHYKSLISWWTKFVTETTKLPTYGSRISRVVLATRLLNSPATVISKAFGHSALSEKVHRYQTFHDEMRDTMQRSGKTLQINPQHALIRDIRRLHEETPDSEDLKKYATYIQDSAMVASGFAENYVDLSHKLVDALSMKMSVDLSEKLEKVDVSHIKIPEKKEDADEKAEEAPILPPDFFGETPAGEEGETPAGEDDVEKFAEGTSAKADENDEL